MIGEESRADLATVQAEKERLELELHRTQQAAALKEQQCDALLVKIGSLQNQVNVAYAGVLLHRNCQMPPLNQGTCRSSFSPIVLSACLESTVQSEHPLRLPWP